MYLIEYLQTDQLVMAFSGIEPRFLKGTDGLGISLKA